MYIAKSIDKNMLQRKIPKYCPGICFNNQSIFIQQKHFIT